MSELIGQTNFPWLMANVLDNRTNKPLGGMGTSRLVEFQGYKVGLLGLVEKEWLETLSTINPEECTYIDHIQEGRRLAKELRAQGAELVLALTHMRMPNDVRLAEEVFEIDAVLGGHDHEYVA